MAKNNVFGKVWKGIRKTAPWALTAATFVIPAAVPVAAGAGILSKLSGTARKVAGVVKGSIGGKVVGGVGKVVIGAVKGGAGAFKKPIKTTSVIGRAANSLITGQTTDIKKEEKQLQSDAIKALTTIQTYQGLVKAGASDAESRYISGLTNAESGNKDADTLDQQNADLLRIQGFSGSQREKDLLNVASDIRNQVKSGSNGLKYGSAATIGAGSAAATACAVGAISLLSFMGTFALVFVVALFIMRLYV